MNLYRRLIRLEGKTISCVCLLWGISTLYWSVLTANTFPYLWRKSISSNYITSFNFTWFLIKNYWLHKIPSNVFYYGHILLLPISAVRLPWNFLLSVETTKSAIKLFYPRFLDNSTVIYHFVSWYERMQTCESTFALNRFWRCDETLHDCRNFNINSFPSIWPLYLTRNKHTGF